MKRFSAFLSFAFLFLAFDLAYAQSNYTPPAGAWERRTPEQSKIDPVKLKEAIDFAMASEARAPRSQELMLTQSFGQAPYGEIVGPVKDRGPITGVIVRSGYIVAEFGEPSRVDMTHSVTKSFLSATVGLAFDRLAIGTQKPGPQELIEDDFELAGSKV